MRANRRTVEDPVTTLRRSLREAQKALELKRQAVAADEEQVARIEKAIAVLEGRANESRVVFRLPPPADLTITRMVTPGTFRLDSQPRYQDTDTQESLARRIVHRQGRPMHIMSIVTSMIEAGYPKTDPFKLRQSLTSTLERRVRDKDTWTKPEAAVFGLEDWGQRQLTFSEEPQ